MFNKSGWLIINICFSCALYIYISIRESIAGFVMGVPPVIQSWPVVAKSCFPKPWWIPSRHRLFQYDLSWSMTWRTGGYPHDFGNLHVFYHQKDRNVDLLEWLSIDPLMNYLLSIHMGLSENIPSKYRVFGRENYDKPLDLYRVPCV